MKVVCVADTHCREWNLGWVPSDLDLLVHAGDGMSTGEKFQEIVVLSRQLEASGLPAVYAAGNHDFLFQRQRVRAEAMLPPGTTYLCDQEATINGMRIYGSPWQPWFYDWAFNLPRNGKELYDKWQQIPNGLDILVTHGPPFGVLDRTESGRRAGCELLAERLRTMEQPPRLHVFGHIHEAYGMTEDGKTIFVNASICNLAYQPVNTPIIVELEDKDVRTEQILSTEAG